MSRTTSLPRAARRRPCSTAVSTAWAWASAAAAKEAAAAGGAGPSCHSATSSGRTPASATVSSYPPACTPAASAAARRINASVLPARAPPTTATREPLPNGVSHSMARTVGSSEPSARRSLGKAAGRSS